jgi:tRNA(Arg) A34 adenosine deaminase TadA
MCRHTRMIARATELAATSDHRKWWLGAVIVRGGRVLGSGVNRFRNPPHINHQNATVHAEVAALRGSLLRRPEVLQSI